MTAKEKILPAAGLLLVSAVVVGLVFRACSDSPRGKALAARHHAMEVLGGRIAKLAPGREVLVLANPFAREAGYLDEKRQYEQAGLRGLRKGLDRHTTVTAVLPDLRPEYVADPQAAAIPADSRTPLSFLVRPDSVDELAGAHPDCRVIVSLIGLPAGIERLKVWQEKDPHCFALLLPDLRLLGGPAEVVAAFRRGKLLAAVVDEPVSGDPLVVTRDNVEEVLRRQPHLLGF